MRIYGDESVNAFQTFYNSIYALNGDMRIQVLGMKQMKEMYPQLIPQLPTKGSNEYMYIFHCNDGLGPGTALTAYKIVRIP